VHLNRFTPFAAVILMLTFFPHRVSADFSGAYTFAPNEGSRYPSQFPVGDFTLNVGTWALSGSISPAFLRVTPHI
jgi:hypothetical protein